MFFDDKTLIRITGKTYPAWQEKWCIKNGLPYTWNDKGQLNVLIDDYVRKFGLKNYKQVQKEQEPEFDAIRNINGKKAKKAQGAAKKSDL